MLHTKVCVCASSQLPLILGLLRRIVEEAHDADRVIGGELAKYTIAVWQTLGKDLKNLQREFKYGRVIRLCGRSKV